MAPGKDAVSGARTDAYRNVWAHVYELDPGTTFTVASVQKAVLDPLGGQLSHQTVRAALHQALLARLCARSVGEVQSGRLCYLWRRLPWPEVVSLRWLRSQGAPDSVARKLLSALESGGFLDGQFRRSD